MSGQSSGYADRHLKRKKKQVLPKKTDQVSEINWITEYIFFHFVLFLSLYIECLVLF